MQRRVLAIGLDGHEQSLFGWMSRHGLLPELTKLRERSARFLLDHGAAVRTGLAWEHFATGLSPDDAGKWAAVEFDPARYDVWQEQTSFVPFPHRLASRTVVVDPPYFDLARAPAVRGIVAWGAHDPGVAATANPPSLMPELAERGLAYPAASYTYGLTWPSAEATARMGRALADAIDRRSALGRWILGERLPDWDLGILVVAELHSALEGFWYGIDRRHPLHDRVPSSPHATRALLEVYRAADRLVGDMVSAFPDAIIVAFSMNGMGPNHSDNASMALLPELLYREAFGHPLMMLPADTASPAELPLLQNGESWGGMMARMLSAVPASTTADARQGLLSLGWMPATRYRVFWADMPAFALPSFYDGRIRINLEGREARGRVPVECHAETCARLESLLSECRDSITGKPAVAAIERPSTSDPRRLRSTESDLIVVWNGPTLGLDHPRHGRIGPLPYRRPGGHTGRYGMMWMSGEHIQPGDRGIASSFDVVPTLIDVLGQPRVDGLSGRSLLASAIGAVRPSSVRAAAAPGEGAAAII